MLKYIFLLFPHFTFSQEKIPKKANTIELIGVSFREVANGLLDTDTPLVAHSYDAAKRFCR